MNRPEIGFIGLGLMGSAMVECLQRQGYRVTVLGHRNRGGIDAALGRGATEAPTARALAAASDIVMLCMSTSDQVEARMRGADGVIAGLKPGAIVIDFGTSLPASTRALAADVAAAGGTYLDAPLGRTPAHARDGLLNIMCAGERAAFDRARPVLDELGENVFYLGPSGTGHAIKLINNAFGLTVANAMAEAFAVADMTGVDRRALYDVMSAGPLHSGMMDFVKGWALDGVPDKLAFSVANAAKDIGYYAQMAAGAGATPMVPAGALAALNQAVEDGLGGAMVAQMVEFFADRMTAGTS